VQVLLAVAALGLLAATAAPFLRHAAPLLALFEHFSVQLGVCALACLVLMLLSGLRLWALLALGLTVWHGSAVYPFLPLPWSPAAATAQGPPLKVLSINLWYKSEQRAETIAYLMDSGADVIATVETTWEWHEELKPLERVYPYHADCIGRVFRCGVALFSKLPLKDAFADRLDGELPTVVGGRIDWQGAPLTIAALQLINPTIGLDEGFQAQQAANVTPFFARLQGDLVVLGDFNSTPWSLLQRDLRAATGLDNRGRLAFTWPAWAPVAFRLPIDQIFTRGAVAARNVRAGPAVGSDHLPILGEIIRPVP
jgi:endonuclease/exonuclease/phosphatase (EEP) superfamily protein YafD